MPPVSRIISLGGGGFYTSIISVSTVTTNLNLYNSLVSTGWDTTAPVQAIINIGANVYSTSTGTPAILIEGLPSGSKIYINVSSGKFVVGAGGTGGGVWSSPTSGSAGGTAIYTRHTTFITNLGTIGGGGGGGGGGSSNYTAGLYNGGSAGGGGAGFGAIGGIVSYAGWTAGNYGSAGTINSGGAGGTASQASILDEEGALIDTLYSGAGGAGGSLGTVGTAGGTGNYTVTQSAGGGGAAGSAIDGSSYTTLQTAGTIAGSQIN